MGEWIEIGENSDKTTQSAELEDGTTTTLTENFYDRERLALSYILNTEGPRIDYDFSPDHEFFELLSESNGLLWYQDLSETQYLEIMAKLKLTDKVGFVIRTVNVGDHVTLADEPISACLLGESLTYILFLFLKMDCLIRQKGKTSWMLYFTSRLMKHISGLKAIRFTPTFRLLRVYLLRLK